MRPRLQSDALARPLNFAVSVRNLMRYLILLALLLCGVANAQIADTPPAPLPCHEMWLASSRLRLSTIALTGDASNELAGDLLPPASREDGVFAVPSLKILRANEVRRGRFA